MAGLGQKLDLNIDMLNNKSFEYIIYVIPVSNHVGGEWRCWANGDQEAQIGNADLVICYLCNKKVLRSEWEKEETDHRSYCAVKSKEHRGKWWQWFNPDPTRQR